jgi:uncharacterized protein
MPPSPTIKHVLDQTSHRPFPLPDGPWMLYQCWKQVLFLHWSVSVESINELLPKGLKADTYEGKAYVSVVPFSVEGMQPRFLGPMPFFSDFHELNLRTYVTDGEKPGIYFFDIKANKILSVLFNKALGLPYSQARIKRKDDSLISRFVCATEKERKIDVSYLSVTGKISKSPLDKWLTERYCDYQKVGDNLFRFPVHHLEWPLQAVSLKSSAVNYLNNRFPELSGSPELIHYSEGVEVLSWKRERVS